MTSARATASGNDIPTCDSDPQQKIEAIRHGLPAMRLEQLAARMGTNKEFLIRSLRISRATHNHEEGSDTLLSSEESERLLGIENLICAVQTMVEQSGNPDGFDAARWLGAWLSVPLPALGGATPGSYMDTIEGQNLVADLLAMTQSGAYA